MEKKEFLIKQITDCKVKLYDCYKEIETGEKMLQQLYGALETLEVMERESKISENYHTS